MKEQIDQRKELESQGIKVEATWATARGGEFEQLIGKKLKELFGKIKEHGSVPIQDDKGQVHDVPWEE
jgi:hypothetical protein